MSDVQIPEWVATVTGRLVLENEWLRRQVEAVNLDERV